MVYVQTWGTKLICVQHFKKTPMNMFMPWVDIRTNKESMIPTLTLTIQDGGIIQISVMKTKHKLLLHHLTIGHRFFSKEVQQPYQARQQVPPTQNSDTSLEDFVKAFSTNTIQFQQETKASIRNLKTQMGQLASTISQIAIKGFREITFSNHSESKRECLYNNFKKWETA